ncbi:(2Fe-2S)-binding protein [Uliginosibacterium sediminicola]|uniref:Bacterioferritin-associated ferredoxin n=1 Tax=Uliginosibacterium sediminicola TaxID=2024550 RepID=A0ABU9Z2Q7_9RHOO
MYVCVCNAVTEQDIATAVGAGARRLRDLRSKLGVAAECGRCAECANACLRQLTSADAEPKAIIHLHRSIPHERRQESLAAA